MRVMGRAALARVGLLYVAFLACAAARAGDVPGTAYGAGSDWLHHGAAVDETGYSLLQQINTRTIGRLGLAFAIDLPGETILEATPLAVHGVLYFTGAYSRVYAADGATGKILWRFDPHVWKHDPRKMRFTLPANRGVAYRDGRLFVGTVDGRLIALAAETGRVLWSVQTLPEDSPLTITGAPCVFKDRVVIGNAGAEYAARGFVTAYDTTTGRQVWRFYTAPGTPAENKGDPAMERAAATWTGPYWKTGTGGTVWNDITYDPELNRLYFGTGNAGPYDPRMRSPGGGDNLYTASIVALDAGSGKYIWHYQVNPRDSWDYDATAEITLATLTIGGAPRKVLMQAPKNGFFYVLDRATGKLISAGKTGKVTWADHIDLASGRPVEAPDIRYETGLSILYPSSLGTHNWQDMSFDPALGLVYIPTGQLGVRITRGAGGAGAAAYAQISVQPYKAAPGDGHGALLAWDPVRQDARWRAPLRGFWNGGTMSTAGGLVFQGAGDGFFSAYDAASGKRLWHFYAGLGIVAPPMSYAANGHQYVAVMSGYGGSGWGEAIGAGWKFAYPRRLYAFALDGHAAPPPTSPPDFTVHALDDPSLQLNEAEVAAGALLYLGNCAGCHGPGLLNAGSPGPDLRESKVALDRAAFWSVLHDGILLPAGMPRFEELSRQQVDQIRAYIRSGAREALGLRARGGASRGNG